MAQKTERKQSLRSASVNSLCQGEGGELKSVELAGNEKLVPRTPQEEVRDSFAQLKDPMGHLLCISGGRGERPSF